MHPAKAVSRVVEKSEVVIVATKDVPPEFRLVTLRDRRTWPRATLAEWIALRTSLLERQSQVLDLEQYAAQVSRARRAAKRELWRQEKVAGRPTQVSIEGKLVQRYEGLVEDYLHNKFGVPRPLGRWEHEFLRASGWIEDLRVAAYRDLGWTNQTHLLGEWILAVEHEYRVAEDRAKKRDNRDQVASRTGRAKTRRGAIEYFPMPLELLAIWRWTFLVVLDIQRYPRRWEEAVMAEYGAKWRDVVPLREWPKENPSIERHRHDIQSLLESITKANYEPAITAEELMRRQSWKLFYDRGTSTLTTEIVAKLFDVKRKTVTNNLAHGILKEHYEACGVPELLRVYRDPPPEGRAVHLYPKGWFDLKRAPGDKWFCSGAMRVVPDGVAI